MRIAELREAEQELDTRALSLAQGYLSENSEDLVREASIFVGQLNEVAKSVDDPDELEWLLVARRRWRTIAAAGPQPPYTRGVDQYVEFAQKLLSNHIGLALDSASLAGLIATAGPRIALGQLWYLVRSALREQASKDARPSTPELDRDQQSHAELH